VRAFPLASRVGWSLARGVTRVLDPLESFPWGALEAGGIVAAALAAPVAPVPSVVVVGTMIYFVASFGQRLRLVWCTMYGVGRPVCDVRCTALVVLCVGRCLSSFGSSCGSSAWLPCRSACDRLVERPI